MPTKPETRRFPRLGGSDRMDIHAVRRQNFESGGPATIFVHGREIADHRAAFAMQCMERWALVVGEPDGEDRAGRQKLRRMTPAELVTAACGVAEEAYRQFAERGWLVTVPAYQDVVDAVKDVENGND